MFGIWNIDASTTNIQTFVFHCLPVVNTCDAFNNPKRCPVNFNKSSESCLRHYYGPTDLQIYTDVTTRLKQQPRKAGVMPQQAPSTLGVKPSQNRALMVQKHSQLLERCDDAHAKSRPSGKAAEKQCPVTDSPMNHTSRFYDAVGMTSVAVSKMACPSTGNRHSASYRAIAKALRDADVLKYISDVIYKYECSQEDIFYGPMVEDQCVVYPSYNATTFYNGKCDVDNKIDSDDDDDDDEDDDEEDSDIDSKDVESDSDESEDDDYW